MRGSVACWAERPEQLLFFLVTETAGNGILRTGLTASAATDTFAAVRGFYRVDTHLTGTGAFSAVYTFFLVDAVTENRHLIENGIKSAQRTEILAKRPVDQDGKQDRHKENGVFPEIEPADGASHSFVQEHQGKSALQSSGRTDELTEIRSALSHNICEKQWEQDHKDQKDHVFQFSQESVSTEGAYFFKKRDFM